MASSHQDAGAGNAPEDEEDDYMNMSFAEPTPAKESSIQRAQRLKKESRARGVIKSNTQLAEEEAANRERALATSMLDDPRSRKSKGLAMMAKMGFKGGALGKKTEDGGDGGGGGRTEPIQISMKEDRGGIGMDNEKKRRLREAFEEREAKAVKVDPGEYRDRVRKEREEARLEKQLHAAQRTAERMDEGADLDSPKKEFEAALNAEATSTRPLKSIPVLYRGLIRHREEQERDRRMRHDLEQSLSRLPAYDDSNEDEDDKRALGKDRTVYATADDLDEEDEELDAFNALDVGARLTQLLAYLRKQHKYCFWCKMAYPDDEMDGCPGLAEEDHD
ncbi:G patch domain-containing protein 11 [Escovopsis weberi]|uniref:G patch domain-containing protein 11 n=1 Tax=Escovopsis weberi TaxID=150374 RepID=A0A0M8N307_ESCWE|nr:G patch domain-containing protein 11 [Escovopsis weberi]